MVTVGFLKIFFHGPNKPHKLGYVKMILLWFLFVHKWSLNEGHRGTLEKKHRAQKGDLVSFPLRNVSSCEAPSIWSPSVLVLFALSLLLRYWLPTDIHTKWLFLPLPYNLPRGLFFFLHFCEALNLIYIFTVTQERKQ